MIDRLPTLAVAVEHQPEAPLRDAFLPGNLVRDQQEMPEQPIVVLSRIQKRREVSARNDQDMDRGLRMDVLEGHGLVILIDDLAGKFSCRDPAKEAGLQGFPYRYSALLFFPKRLRSSRASSDGVIP